MYIPFITPFPSSLFFMSFYYNIKKLLKSKTTLKLWTIFMPMQN